MVAKREVYRQAIERENRGYTDEVVKRTEQVTRLDNIRNVEDSNKLK